MSKSTTVTVSLDEDAYGVFQTASEIVSKAGIRVPTGQLVQTMTNAEMCSKSGSKPSTGDELIWSYIRVKLERVTRLELATSTLARLHSTN